MQILFSFLLFFAPLAAQLHQYALDCKDHALEEFIWEKEALEPFQELLLSWNAERPSRGMYSFWVSLKQNDRWSDWVYHADWAADGQMMCNEHPFGSFVKGTRDGVRMLQGFATGFRIKVFAIGCEMQGMRRLYASLSDGKGNCAEHFSSLEKVLLEDFPRKSQISLRQPRHQDFSFPVASSCAVSFLLRRTIDPLEFAKGVYDSDFDSYEGWSFHAAESFRLLGGSYEAHVERLSSFQALHAHLLRGMPVLVGIKGTLSGAPRPYYFEHIVCVIGYDPAGKRVYAIDSSFPNDRSTFTSYPLDDFLKAWGKQKNIAFVFCFY